MSLSVEIEMPCPVCESKTAIIPVTLYYCEECQGVAIRFPDGTVWIEGEEDLEELVWSSIKSS